jgi:hypothetical protein
MASLQGSAASAGAKAARLERAGDLAGALAAYEAALALAPDDPGLLAAVARLAMRMEAPAIAAEFWTRVLRLQPDLLEAVDGRARALRELGRYDEAVEVLRGALLVNPQEARLWNSLGTTLTQASRGEEALTFFDEAVRLDPRFAGALYNRAGAQFDLGRFEAAAADYAQARKAARKPADVALIEFAAATLSLACGNLGEGWDAYETRFARDLPRPVAFKAPGRRWTPDAPLEGRRLLAIGEQGLGDELMFANLVPDVIEALGPDGRLSLAVEPRLVELFRRSFPAASVSAHTTELVGQVRRRGAADPLDPKAVDYWTPLGSLNRRFRRDLADFPDKAGYLCANPEQVARWRDWLAGHRPAVGISWRSSNVLGDRQRQYPPLEEWAAILRAPGVSFVGIQYGDCAGELKALRELTGGEILEPPGLDIRNDIDGLAALCVALDLVVSVGNATSALAGACGAPTVLVSGPAAWPQLGTDGYPWYPSVRCLAAETYGDWRPVMDQAAALTAAVRAA